MWILALLSLLQTPSLPATATPPTTWFSGQELLKNPTMTYPVMRDCLNTPARLDTDFRYENLPTARLRGALNNLHGGSLAWVSVSPVPCERPLVFTFFAYTKAKKQKLVLGVHAEGEKHKILYTFVDGPKGPFGNLGCFGQLVALASGEWRKIEKTYVVPKGTRTLIISVDNGDPQDVHIAQARLTVGENVSLASRQDRDSSTQ